MYAKTAWEETSDCCIVYTVITEFWEVFGFKVE
jgi:hypothetical protein